MSFPQFNVTTKLVEGAQTTLLSLIRGYNSLISNLQQIFTALLNKVQLDSVILNKVSLSVGQNVIPHTLGRTLTGWELIRQRGQASIWDSQDNNPNPGNYLLLMSSAAVSVDILVF
jgi:hypothetical protein